MGESGEMGNMDIKNRNREYARKEIKGQKSSQHDRGRGGVCAVQVM